MAKKKEIEEPKEQEVQEQDAQNNDTENSVVFVRQVEVIVCESEEEE